MSATHARPRFSSRRLLITVKHYGSSMPEIPTAPVALSNTAPPDISTAAEVIRSANFAWTEQIHALRVPNQRVHLLNKDKELRPLLYRRSRQRTVVASDSSNFKMLLLAPGIKHTELPERIRTEFQDSDVLPYSLNLGYEDLNAEEALRRVLPREAQEEGVPGSFEPVGHLAHFNLKERFWPYRYLIGKIIVDKNPSIKTVVTKVGKLSNKYRTFDMELIGGENKTWVSVSENGIHLRFDFRMVYWNTRLSTERIALLSTVSPYDVVCDLFAGVGAFAIFCAKKGCKVISNDLNPAGADAQRQNAVANKVKIEVLNLDARACVRELEARPELDVKANQRYVPRIVVIMNLPELALDFLDVFREAVVDGKNRLFSSSNFTLSIRCYCFATTDPPKNEIYPRLVAALGSVPAGTVIHEIRNVAPNKQMYRVDFDVPAAGEHQEEPPAKQFRQDRPIRS
eukprot:gnl/MRDRNA2_/MRDRNA2_232392_c0_seq1.p1 gnl/MRDRNA2_/MRDRNA2_232392_c0~~gnl/MRDRNA2_/MRDRNA2_232392_c0_seq1.p1  ORF type:complete len:496 (+),score=74.10 gnl/MRDRNA2_/MRDRNA2_232392_c0_seq1:122-1489(+)